MTSDFNKKILICTSSNGYIGGSERTLLGFIKRTNNSKDNIAIVLPKIKINDFLFQLKSLNICIFNINIDKFRNVEKNFLKNVSSLFLSIINKIVYFIKFNRIVKIYNPYILYLNNVYCEIEAIVGKLHRKKVIWHIKGWGSKSNFINFFRILIITRCSDEIIVLKDYDKFNILKYVKNKDYYTNKIKVIPEGLDLENFQNNTNLNDDDFKFLVKSKEQGKVIIGMVSSINLNKGIDMFADSAAFFSKNKNLVFVHVGKTAIDNSNYLISILEKNKEIINKSLFFMDYKKNLKLFFDLIDIFLFPSHSEGFPISILEAMYFGKPVLASNIEGNLAIIDNNINGILFLDNDLNDLNEKLSKLINDEKLRNLLGNNAKKKIIESYLIDKNINLIDELIDNLFNKG